MGKRPFRLMFTTTGATAKAYGRFGSAEAATAERDFYNADRQRYGISDEGGWWVVSGPDGIVAEATLGVGSYSGKPLPIWDHWPIP